MTGLECSSGFASDAAGNLYAAQFVAPGTVLKITPGGLVSTYATGLSHPDGIDFGPAGELYVGDRDTAQVMRVPPGGGAATVHASGLSFPLGVTADNAGNVYVSRFTAGAVTKISSTGVVSAFGSGFANPLGIAFDPGGNLFFADFGANRVYKVADVAEPSGDITPPVISGTPADMIVEATSPGGAFVNYTTPTATDDVDVAVPVTCPVGSDFLFGLGTTTVTCTATDAAGNSSETSFTITVRDTKAPMIWSVTPLRGTLWPPNHQMVSITVSAEVTDAVGVASMTVIGVTSSEPDNDLGDGDTAGDVVITGPLSVSLRAERSGMGSGRIYTITVQARDADGNVSTKTCTVVVPKSQGK